MKPCTFALQQTKLPARRFRTRAELLQALEAVRLQVAADPCQDWTLARMAHAACLSAAHFNRRFREAFGESPGAYRSRMRMEVALQRLIAGQPVSEVCFECGFSSVGSFSRDYRKRYGVPPSRVFASLEKRLTDPSP